VIQGPRGVLRRVPQVERRHGGHRIDKRAAVRNEPAPANV
jgi:hypothetical protein